MCQHVRQLEPFETENFFNRSILQSWSNIAQLRFSSACAKTIHFCAASRPRDYPMPDAARKGFEKQLHSTLSNLILRSEAPLDCVLSHQKNPEALW